MRVCFFGGVEPVTQHRFLRFRQSAPRRGAVPALSAPALADEGEPEIHWFEGDYSEVLREDDMVTTGYREPWYIWTDEVNVMSQFSTYGWTFDAETGTATEGVTRYYYVTGDYSDGLTPVRESGGNKYGYVDESGEIAIPVVYDEADYFSEGLAGVMVRDADGIGKCGYINTSGEVVIPLEYKTASAFGNGRAVVIDTDGNWFSIDKTGAKTQVASHDGLSSENRDHLMVVYDKDEIGNGYYGVINTAGEVVLESVYESVSIGNGYIQATDKNYGNLFRP